MILYCLAWFPMVAIAVANGLLRDLVYGRRMAELRAHQLSTLLGIVLLGLYIWAVMQRWPPISGGQAGRVGLLWFILTVGFEFGFGHYVAGHSWKRLRQNYNLMAGRVWPFILVWVAVAPYVFYLVRQRDG
jgi:hypothetical protein